MHPGLSSAPLTDEPGLRGEDSDAEQIGPLEPVERELAARIATGDVGAFSAVLDRYWQPLVRYAQRRLGSHDAAEDAVQEAFVRLWAKRATVKAEASLRGYLYRLVHNLTIDELRKRQVRGLHGRFPHPDPSSPPTPAQVTEGDELASAAAEAIRALPARRRDVFVLGHLHDLSYREIAEALDVTPRTVANHMTLALRDLRHALRPFLDET